MHERCMQIPCSASHREDDGVVPSDEWTDGQEIQSVGISMRFRDTALINGTDLFCRSRAARMKCVGAGILTPTFLSHLLFNQSNTSLILPP